MRKYEFTGETWEVGGVVLHRIRAIRDFGSVRAGDIGGFVEVEANLPHDNDAWVGGNTVVRDNAVVCGGAVVSGSAVVSDGLVRGNAKISDGER